GQDFAGLFDVRPFQADHHGDFEADFAGGFYQGLGDDVALGDAAEDVHQNPLHGRFRENDAEGFDGALGGDGAADVQEIGGLGAVEFDEVHGGHGQAGAVDEAADVAVQGDVIQARLVGAH